MQYSNISLVVLLGNQLICYAYHTCILFWPNVMLKYNFFCIFSSELCNVFICRFINTIDTKTLTLTLATVIISISRITSIITPTSLFVT